MVSMPDHSIFPCGETEGHTLLRVREPDGDFVIISLPPGYYPCSHGCTHNAERSDRGSQERGHGSREPQESHAADTPSPPHAEHVNPRQPAEDNTEQAPSDNPGPPPSYRDVLRPAPCCSEPWAHDIGECNAVDPTAEPTSPDRGQEDQQSPASAVDDEDDATPPPSYESSNQGPSHLPQPIAAASSYMPMGATACIQALQPTPGRPHPRISSTEGRNTQREYVRRLQARYRAIREAQQGPNYEGIRSLQPPQLIHRIPCHPCLMTTQVLPVPQNSQSAQVSQSLNTPGIHQGPQVYQAPPASSASNTYQMPQSQHGTQASHPQRPRAHSASQGINGLQMPRLPLQMPQQVPQQIPQQVLFQMPQQIFPQIPSQPQYPINQHLRPSRRPPTVYDARNYEHILALHSVFMDDHGNACEDESWAMWEGLIQPAQPEVVNHPVDDDGFIDMIYALHNADDDEPVVYFSKYLCPSVSDIARQEPQSHLRLLATRKQATWNQARTIFGPFPCPTYTCGASKEAFDPCQINSLMGFFDQAQAYNTRRWGGISATSKCLFPFLTVEAGLEDLELLQRKNAHSIGIALNGIISLVETAEMTSVVEGNIIAISIAHNHEEISIHGHYFVTAPGNNPFSYEICSTVLWDHDIHTPCIEDVFKPYDFVRLIYKRWAGQHIVMLREAVRRAFVKLARDKIELLEGEKRRSEWEDAMSRNRAADRASRESELTHSGSDAGQATPTQSGPSRYSG